MTTSVTLQLAPRYRLQLADKADIDARRQEKFQSVQPPELDEYLGAEFKTGEEIESSETDEILQKITCDDGGDTDSEQDFHDKKLSRIQSDDGEEEPVFSEKSAELEKACTVALDTVCEARVAKLSTGNTEELMEFVMKGFDGLHPSKKKQLKESASSKKAQLHLNCKVLRGSGLTAMDPNGKSDPYCRMGLLSEAHLHSEITKQKQNLTDWADAGMIEHSQLHVTTVKFATLEPEWNEMIEMPIGDVNDEHLVVEVWDCDENDTRIQGFKGFKTYIAEKTTKKGDDFMGRLFHPLRLIFMQSGEEKTFTLLSHSGKTKRGTITLQLSIKATKESLPMETAMNYYNILAHSLVNSCTKRDERYQRKWDGQLPPEAEKLLEYNALLNNICEVQKAYTKLSMLLSYHMVYHVELSTFCDQIKSIRAAEALPHQHLPYFSPTQEQIKFLFNEFENQTSACIEAIMRNTDTKCCRKFEEKVKIFHQLYSFGPFTERLPPGSRSCDELLERCTSVIVAKWFLEQYAELFTKSGKEVSHDGFKSLMERCVDRLEKGLRILHPYFVKVGVNFFSHLFVSFDKLIGAEGETRVCRTNDSSLALYPVYLCFRRIEKLSQNVDKTHLERGLHLLKSLDWFERCSSVPQWIKVAVEKCKQYIGNAVADDLPIPVTECVKFSRSAQHAEVFLYQVGTFWKNLDWPEPQMSSCYAVMVVNGIAECCVYYVNESAKQLLDEKGNFHVNEKLNIFLNNVNYICSRLSECSQWLELDPFYNWLENEQIELDGEKCKSLIEKIIQEANKEIHGCTHSIKLEIAKKLVPNIQEFLRRMIKDKNPANSRDQLAASEFYAPLLDYLTDNLKTFMSSLYPSVATGILLCLWEAIVDSVEKCVGEIPRKKGKDSTHLYYKLFLALRLLRKFFHLGGEGIAKEKLDTKKFNELYCRLDILSKPTEDLVFEYLSDLTQLQPRDDDINGEEKEEGREKTFGTLHFSVAYLKGRSTVEVNVMQAVDLPAFDSSCNGLSDPCVQVSLMPPWIFPKASQKAKVYEKTLINEEMSLPASEENFNTENTVLLLSVFNRDTKCILCSDCVEGDFAGLCVVPCKDIPWLGTDAEQRATILEVGAPQRKVFRLPLFHPPKFNASPIRAELESRARLSYSKAKQVIKTVPSSPK